MNVDQAIRQVNSMIFRPGWSFRATSSKGWGYFGNTGTEIYVQPTIETVDTRFVSRDGKYTTPMTLKGGGGAMIDVADLDEAGLCYAILAKVVRPLDEHEDREFLQVRTVEGEWVSPLHYHTDEGQVAWQRCGPARMMDALHVAREAADDAARLQEAGLL